MRPMPLKGCTGACYRCPKTCPVPKSRACWTGKILFRCFFHIEPTVGDVFFGLQGDGRITRDFGREEVFAVFKHAFWIAVPPVVVDFVNRAVVPVLKLPVRQQDAGFFPNFAPCRLGDGFARFEAAGYRLPKSFLDACVR